MQSRCFASEFSQTLHWHCWLSQNVTLPRYCKKLGLPQSSHLNKKNTRLSIAAGGRLICQLTELNIVKGVTWGHHSIVQMHQALLGTLEWEYLILPRYSQFQGLKGLQVAKPIYIAPPPSPRFLKKKILQKKKKAFNFMAFRLHWLS